MNPQQIGTMLFRLYLHYKKHPWTRPKHTQANIVPGLATFLRPFRGLGRYEPELYEHMVCTTCNTMYDVPCGSRVLFRWYCTNCSIGGKMQGRYTNEEGNSKESLITDDNSLHFNKYYTNPIHTILANVDCDSRHIFYLALRKHFNK